MDAGSVKRVECDEDPTTSQKTARPSRHFNASHKKMSKFDFAPPPPSPQPWHMVLGVQVVKPNFFQEPLTISAKFLQNE